MSGYSRMVVIPQEEYIQLTAVQQARQPLTQQFYKAERDFQESRQVKDPHRSMMLQSENLERMKDLKDQMRSYLTISTPKPYRTRAEALFQSIEPHLNVNEKGEIIKEDNNVIQSSRYEDLIQHAVRDRRRNFTPTGWTYFLELLKKHNVPRASLNRDTLDELDSPKPPVPMNIKSSPKSFHRARSPSVKRRVSNIKTSPKSTQKSRSRSRGRQRGRQSMRNRIPPKKYMFSDY